MLRRSFLPSFLLLLHLFLLSVPSVFLFSLSIPLSDSCMFSLLLDTIRILHFPLLSISYLSPTFSPCFPVSSPHFLSLFFFFFCISLVLFPVVNISFHLWCLVPVHCRSWSLFGSMGLSVLPVCLSQQLCSVHFQSSQFIPHI